MSEKCFENQLSAFLNSLWEEEKSPKTIEKYERGIHAVLYYIKGEISKEQVISYKQHLKEQGYAIRSINSMLTSVNRFLNFIGLSAYKVKNLRCQRQTYCAEEKELSKAEYLRPLEASKKKKCLNLILQTIFGTGICISELKYFTVESVKRGEISVQCKSKIRTILTERS